MTRTTIGKLALLFAMVGALALAGCGGDDGYSISAEDQARIDALTADLADAEGDLAAANKNAADQKKAADDLAAAKAMADADLATAQAALTAAQATVDELTMQIGMDPSDDDPNGAGLKGDLAMAIMTRDAAEDKVDGLEATITGLNGQLAQANDALENPRWRSPP